jgi:hypothetical protein
MATTSPGGYQFVREECYAIVRGQAAPATGAGRAQKGGVAKRGAGKRAARDIIGEAVRNAGDHPHVEQPAPPRVLHGMAADEMLLHWAQVEELARGITTTTKAGVVKRQRTDVPILIGTVCSYPGPPDDNDPLYVRWRALTTAWLRERYGDRILTIVEHVDEPHGHIHCLVADRGRPVKGLMAGHGAQLAAEAEGKPKKEAALAYKAAARALQDDFYAQVGIEAGLTRIGPQPRSLPKPAWHAERQQARAIAEALLRKDQEEAELEAKLVEIRAQQARTVADRQKLVAAAQALEAQRRELAGRQKELDRLLEAMTPAQQEEAARRYDAAKRAEEKQPAPLMRNESAPAGPQKAPRPR